MPILSTDLQWRESERMTDAADGGGRMTSNEIPDGVSGNIFPKVSRLDTTYGRASLRQVFAGAFSENRDTLAGAHAIITAPPANDRIGVLMFSTGSHNATRDQLRNWIESYVVGGPLSRLRIYGVQAQGQRAILAYQREEDALPDIGDVCMLSVEARGYTPEQQFVRIESIEHELRTFTDDSGDFVRRVLSIRITTPLTATFPGSEPVRYSVDPSPTKIRDTQVADTARYYGITRVAEAIQIGALNARVSSIYAPLVPATERETPVSLVQPTGSSGWVAAGDPMTIQWGYAANQQAVTNYAPTSVLPGSWVLLASNFSIRDQGDGTITGDYGTTGTIDYETGQIKLTFVPQYPSTFYGSFNQRYTPAVRAQARAHTRRTAVTLQTRGMVQTLTCNPLPSPGSLTVDYRALGKWYRLRDTGAGELAGNGAAEGGGSVSYSSGAVIVTLGALPDVGSSVIYSWGSPIHYVIRAAASTANPSNRLELRFTLENTPVRPGSLSIGWRRRPDLPEYVYTDAGGTGVLTLSGHRPGTIDYTTGEVVLPVPMHQNGYRPGTDTLLNITYEQDQAALNAPPLVSTDTVAVTTPTAWNCGKTNITPRSARIVCPLVYGPSNQNQAAVTLVDNGAGGLVTLAGSAGSGYHDKIWWAAGEVVGSIDYSTGDVVLSGITVSSYYYSQVWDAIQHYFYGQWNNTGGVWPFQIGDYQVTARSGAAATFAARSESRAVADIGFNYDLTATTPQPVMQGSVFLAFSGINVYDRAGNLYYDHQPSTNIGTLCGTINYATGRCSFTSLPSDSNAAGNLEMSASFVKACLTTYGEFSSVAAEFRTSGAPIRPASLYVQATAVDGTLCSGFADVNGNITGDHIRGSIDTSSGAAAVEFGDMVSSVWEPRPVWPSSIRYSCTVLSNLPLDAEILGLDPVRLPSDGCVPMVRPGDVCVVHETQSVSVPSPAAGALITSGRSPRTASGGPNQPDIIIPAATGIEFRDATGKRLPDTLYVPDLENGNATLANPLNLTGYTAPLTMRVTWEDMALVSDAQINGSIALSAPTLYAYSTSAYLSTALLFGDLAARVEHVFDQQTWTSVWSSSLIGNPATGELNVLQYPIEVSNAGAIKQRWRAQVTSTSPLTVQIHGEDLGLIGTFPATADIAPINPLTGQPYFVIRAAAWGAAGAWATGNNVRWDTVAAAAPVDFSRTVLAGAARTGDSFHISLRGDVD